MNEYYEWQDGWFLYYINIKTGEKKLTLDDNDKVVPYAPDFLFPEPKERQELWLTSRRYKMS